MTTGGHAALPPEPDAAASPGAGRQIAEQQEQEEANHGVGIQGAPFLLAPF